jgi:flagellar hook-associated protein FlgK
VEAPGIEKANDLRDQRDAAIDELSKYIDITYYESENKETIINAAGVPLVTSGELTAMSTRVVEGTTLVIPTWPSYERDVYEDGKFHTFPISRVYQAHIPTSPSGYWLFGFASKKYHPLKDFKPAEWKRRNIHTEYYTTNLHTGAFMLPKYVEELLEQEEER